MATMIIRGLDDDILKALRRRAKLEGVTPNTALIKFIKDGLGFAGFGNEAEGNCKKQPVFLWAKPY